MTAWSRSSSLLILSEARTLPPGELTRSDYGGEAVAGHIALGRAVDDLAVGVDDGDLLPGLAGLHAGGHIVREVDELDVLEVVLDGQDGQLLFELAGAQEPVHEPVVEAVLREAELEPVDQLVEPGGVDAAGLRDLGADGLPERIDHPLVLLAVLRAGVAAGERLAGGLVFAVADQLDVDAELLQQVAEEDHLRADAGQRRVAADAVGHIDLVGHGSEVVGARAQAFEVGDDGFAARGAEVLERLAQLLEVGYAGGVAVGAEINVLDRRVFGGGVHGLHGIPDADDGRGGGLTAHQQGRRVQRAEGIGAAGLLAEHGFVHVDLEDTLPGEDRLGARREGSQHAEEEEEANDPGDEDAADHSQNHFDKIFHTDIRDILTKVGKFAE